jgi:hypothetical protein
MEVSGQLHDPAALPSGKKPLVAIVYFVRRNKFIAILCSLFAKRMPTVGWEHYSKYTASARNANEFQILGHSLLLMFTSCRQITSLQV